MSKRDILYKFCWLIIIIGHILVNKIKLYCFLVISFGMGVITLMDFIKIKKNEDVNFFDLRFVFFCFIYSLLFFSLFILSLINKK